jgi:putative copper resistance protein D
LEGLAPIDAWALAAILAKATGYAAALLAMGGPLFLATFRGAPEAVLRLTRTLAAVAAVVGLSVLVVQFGIRSARISGLGLRGATDAVMLGLVWDSPLGTAALWRGAGQLLVLAVLSKGRGGLAAGLVGAVLIAVSYAFVGHSLGDPRWLLGGLLIVHLLATAFWVGALAPLHRATRHAGCARMLQRFGAIAMGTVAVLVAAGLVFALNMTGSAAALVGTAYGLTLMAKLCVVSLLLGLGALNKWRLVPAVVAGRPFADRALRRSIAAEALAIAIILLVTATLTSVTTPPVNL